VGEPITQRRRAFQRRNPKGLVAPVAEKWIAPHGLVVAQTAHDELVTALHELVKAVRAKSETCENEYDVTKLCALIDSFTRETEANVRLLR
jgi:hypothetical protein